MKNPPVFSIRKYRKIERRESGDVGMVFQSGM
jgi:hypothetical protein